MRWLKQIGKTNKMASLFYSAIFSKLLQKQNSDFSLKSNNNNSNFAVSKK